MWRNIFLLSFSIISKSSTSSKLPEFLFVLSLHSKRTVPNVLMTIILSSLFTQLNTVIEHSTMQYNQYTQPAPNTEEYNTVIELSTVQYNQYPRQHPIPNTAWSWWGSQGYDFLPLDSRFKPGRALSLKCWAFTTTAINCCKWWCWSLTQLNNL